MARFSISIFLKGLLMGLCDIVPGISGGTIAFITGIYERLVSAIKGFSPSILYHLVKLDRHALKEDVRRLDLSFLAVLVAGILIAVVFFSRAVLFFLENYFSFTMMLFVGLIIASAKTIFDHIERHHSLNTAFMILGLVLGISLAFLIPGTNNNPSLEYVFLGGFLGICAMILPGVSGSFILLVLGIYEFVLGVIHDFIGKFDYFVAFVVGALAGLFTVSRIVSYVLEKDKSKTLYFLLGLVLGCLSVPLKEVYSVVDLSSLSVISHLVLLVVGAMLGVWITRISRKKN